MTAQIPSGVDIPQDPTGQVSQEIIYSDEPIYCSVAERRKSIDSGFITLDELERRCQDQPREYLVEGLLPAEDIHIAVGDSGLGKTPWAYQLGLCVATGTPFLGMIVRQGKVLYLDLENGREDILTLGQTICSHLGIKPSPKDFLVFDGSYEMSLEESIALHNPILAIVDTLRMFAPYAETTNEEAGSFLKKWRTIARDRHCAILLLHHPRKPNAEISIPALESTPLIEWLHEASGARALVNQTNARIGFDRPRGRDDCAFVMKSHVKTKSESEAIYIERVLDEDGEPLGYKRMVGVELLGNQHQADAFHRLPEEFTFKRAKEIYGRSDDPTKKWLNKCEAVGIVRQIVRGRYRRISPDNALNQ